MGLLGFIFGPLFIFAAVMVYTEDVAPVRAELAEHDPSTDFSSVPGGCLITAHEFQKAPQSPEPDPRIPKTWDGPPSTSSPY